MSSSIKSICSASGVSAFLGIIEPAMFGVTLKLRYTFYGAMIGSAFYSFKIYFWNYLYSWFKRFFAEISKI